MTAHLLQSCPALDLLFSITLSDVNVRAQPQANLQAAQNKDEGARGMSEHDGLYQSVHECSCLEDVVCTDHSATVQAMLLVCTGAARL